MKIGYLLLSLLSISGCVSPVIRFDPSVQYEPKNKISFMRSLQDQNVYIEGFNGFGSGIVIYQDNQNAYILTDRHCVKDDRDRILGNVIIYKTDFCDGFVPINLAGHKGEVISWSDPDLDLAIIKYDVAKHGKFNHYASLQEHIINSIGTRTYHCGNPQGDIAFYSEGIVSSYYYNHGYLQMTSTSFIDFGSSGGGLYSSDGNLIGIAKALINQKMPVFTPSVEIYKWIRSTPYSFILYTK